MIVCIDVGNTNLTIGAYENGNIKTTWRIDTDEFSYEKLIISFEQNNIDNITGISVGSVVNVITSDLQKLKSDYDNVPVIFYGDDIDLIMDIPFANYREVGADIILNGIAGIEKYKSDILVVDFGTATTFDLFKQNYEFCGTSIAPGVNLSLSALSDKASALPEIEIKPTKKVIGQNTVDCMQSGIFWGYLNMINGMIDQIKSESGLNLKVIATGGLASLYAQYTDKINAVDDDLTLNGLYILFARNNG